MKLNIVDLGVIKSYGIKTIKMDNTWVKLKCDALRMEFWGQGLQNYICIICEV